MRSLTVFHGDFGEIAEFSCVTKARLVCLPMVVPKIFPKNFPQDFSLRFSIGSSHMFPTCFPRRSSCELPQMCDFLLPMLAWKPAERQAASEVGSRDCLNFFGGYPNWLVVTGTMEFSGRYIYIDKLTMGILIILIWEYHI